MEISSRFRSRVVKVVLQNADHSQRFPRAQLPSDQQARDRRGWMNQPCQYALVPEVFQGRGLGCAVVHRVSCRWTLQCAFEACGAQQCLRVLIEPLVPGAFRPLFGVVAGRWVHRGVRGIASIPDGSTPSLDRFACMQTVGSGDQVQAAVVYGRGGPLGELGLRCVCRVGGWKGLFFGWRVVCLVPRM